MVVLFGFIYCRISLEKRIQYAQLVLPAKIDMDELQNAFDTMARGEYPVSQNKDVNRLFDGR